MSCLRSFLEQVFQQCIHPIVLFLQCDHSRDIKNAVLRAEGGTCGFLRVFIKSTRVRSATGASSRPRSTWRMPYASSRSRSCRTLFFEGNPGLVDGRGVDSLFELMRLKRIKLALVKGCAFGMSCETRNRGGVCSDGEDGGAGGAALADPRL
jgi:hypothetical protein